MQRFVQILGSVFLLTVALSFGHWILAKQIGVPLIWWSAPIFALASLTPALVGNLARRPTARKADESRIQTIGSYLLPLVAFLAFHVWRGLSGQQIILADYLSLIAFALALRWTNQVPAVLVSAIACALFFPIAETVIVEIGFHRTPWDQRPPCTWWLRIWYHHICEDQAIIGRSFSGTPWALASSYVWLGFLVGRRG